MSRYRETDYSLPYALENIGDYFWRLFRDELRTLAADRNRTDIIQHIHQEWDNTSGCSPVGTDIRIEWAMAIYDHGDWENSLSAKVPSSDKSSVKLDPRRRYPAEYRSDNGVYVRSVSELCIANWLHANQIPFEYERSVYYPRSKETAHCDFYLPQFDVYMEFWGISGNPEYESYKRWKEANYLNNAIRLISLYPSDLKNLRDRFYQALYQICPPKV